MVSADGTGIMLNPYVRSPVIFCGLSWILYKTKSMRITTRYVVIMSIQTRPSFLKIPYEFLSSAVNGNKYDVLLKEKLYSNDKKF